MINTGEAGCDSSQPATLVLGLGNPLRGDDGVGPFVVKALEERHLPQGVEALDGGSGGLALLQIIEGRDRVIVIDAAEMGRQPGEFVRFQPEEARFAQRSEEFSFHETGLGEALALAKALDQPLPEMVIFGVQPAQMDWGESLSPAVRVAVPDLVEAILAELDC
jgi:hydrogenase maturation protease